MSADIDREGERGEWFTNDKKANKFKAEEPEKYMEFLKLMAQLEDIRARKKELSYLESETVAEIANLNPPYKATYGGFGPITVSKSKGKRWDHEAVWNVLMARALDSRRIDKETGEVLEREATAVRRVIEECAYIGYWRLEPLREYGIDPDEYYETTSSKPSIRIG